MPGEAGLSESPVGVRRAWGEEPSMRDSDPNGAGPAGYVARSHCVIPPKIGVRRPPDVVWMESGQARGVERVKRSN